MKKIKAILARALSAKEVKVSVGVHSDAMDDEGEPIAKRAIRNEYGTDKIPSRPFMAITKAVRAYEIKKDTQDLSKRVIAGNISLREAGQILGDNHKKAIQHTIGVTNIPPPLSYKTVKKKGSTKTLVDTGALLNSIKVKHVV